MMQHVTYLYRVMASYPTVSLVHTPFLHSFSSFVTLLSPPPPPQSFLSLLFLTLCSSCCLVSCCAVLYSVQLCTKYLKQREVT